MLDNIHRYSGMDTDEMLAQVLGPAYRDYRQAWRAASPAQTPGFPVHLDIELNDKCNQRCLMCPRNEATHDRFPHRLNTGTSMPFELFRGLVDEGVPKGLRSINFGAFAEPLLHPRLFEMVAYARDKGVIDTRIITNGQLLAQHLDDVFASGLVHLFVSIDAFRDETYRKIRGGRLDKVKENVLALMAAKRTRRSPLPVTRVSFVDFSANAGEQEPFVEFWQDRVDFVDIQMYDDFNAAPPSREAVRALPRKWACTSPWARLAVLANGTILPCCNFNGYNVPVGRIQDMTLEEAWRSSRLAAIRTGILEDSLDNCAACQRNLL